MIPHFLYHWLELFLIERKDSFYRSTGHKNSIFLLMKILLFLMILEQSLGYGNFHPSFQTMRGYLQNFSSQGFHFFCFMIH